MQSIVRIILPFVCGTLIAAGCTTDASFERQEGEVAMNLSEVRLPAEEVETRAGMVIENPNAEMGFFRKGSGYYTTMKNIPYVYEAGKGWHPRKEEETVWLHHETADLVAYYPYNASLLQIPGKTGVVRLTAGIRGTKNSQDFWYKRFTASNRDSQVGFTLEQAYCRMLVTFVIDDTSGYVEEPYLYSFKMSGLKQYADLDLFQGTKSKNLGIINVVDVTDYSNAYVVKADAAETKAKFDLLIIPGSDNSNMYDDQVILEVTVGGTRFGEDTKTMRAYVPYVAFGKGTSNEGVLVPGNVYQLTVKIKGSQIGGVATAMLNGWQSIRLDGDGDLTSTGKDHYYEFDTPDAGGDNLEYITVGGVRWAKNDLAYDPVAKRLFIGDEVTEGDKTTFAWMCVHPYKTFVTIPCYEDIGDQYATFPKWDGAFVPWGLGNYRLYKDHTIDEPYDAATGVADPAQWGDPCRAVGKNWRMPTYNEAYLLCYYSNTPLPSGTFDANVRKTYADWDVYMQSSELPNQNPDIRWAWENTQLVFKRDTRYWCSTSVPRGDDSKWRGAAYFYEYETAIARMRIGMDARTFGFSVRCVYAPTDY